MTSQIIMIFQHNPIFLKKPFFQNDQIRFRWIEFGDHKTDTDGVLFLALAGKYDAKEISSLEYHGITKGCDESSSASCKLRNLTVRSHNQTGRDILKFTSPDSHFAIFETHDAYSSHELAFMFLELLSEQDKNAVMILGSNFSDVTYDVKERGKQIKNLSDASNLFLNENAIIAFELYPRSQRRIMAHEKKPESTKKFFTEGS